MRGKAVGFSRERLREGRLGTLFATGSGALFAVGRDRENGRSDRNSRSSDRKNGSTDRFARPAEGDEARWEAGARLWRRRFAELPRNGAAA